MASDRFRTSASEVIEATLGHPFWVIEGESLAERPRPEHSPKAPATSCLAGRWVDAGDLQVGDVLLLKHSRRAAVTQLAVREANEKVYNIKVEELHCYAVGESPILVHNNSSESLLNEDDQKIVKAGDIGTYWGQSDDEA